MDYFNDAFGDFNPQGDPKVAVKFVLNSILMDDRLNELTCLLTDGHDIGGVEGEPGWIVERRDKGPSGDMPGYVDWPAGANFHVYVDRNSFELAYPEQFMKNDEFHSYVHKAIDAYIVKNPAKIIMGRSVISKLEG